jgi:hypothetical protein
VPPQVGERQAPRTSTPAVGALFIHTTDRFIAAIQRLNHHEREVQETTAERRRWWGRSSRILGQRAKATEGPHALQ